MVGTALDVTLREPRESDWPAILALANESVAHVAGAGSQDEWLRNRRLPSSTRRHVVAIEGGAPVGYAAIEARFEEVDGGYRIFVVASPWRLAEIGDVLLGAVDEQLAALGAAEAWMIEYASDRSFLAFLAARGFGEVRRFRLESGIECVVVARPSTGS